jgi:predicted PurR-regulated permease PerM
MLGIDPRAARITWTVFLVLLFIDLAWMARTTLLVFTIALLLAYGTPRRPIQGLLREVGHRCALADRGRVIRGPPH